MYGSKLEQTVSMSQCGCSGLRSYMGTLIAFNNQVLYALFYYHLDRDSKVSIACLYN